MRRGAASVWIILSRATIRGGRGAGLSAYMQMNAATVLSRMMSREDSTACCAAAGVVVSRVTGLCVHNHALKSRSGALEHDAPPHVIIRQDGPTITTALTLQRRRSRRWRRS